MTTKTENSGANLGKDDEFILGHIRLDVLVRHPGEMGLSSE